MADLFLAFDFGTQRIGVAVGQRITSTARALEELPNRAGQPDWEGIARLIETWKPSALIVGLPLRMDGGEQDMTHAANRFGRQLEGRYHLPVHTADERLTTRAARDLLAERGHRQPDYVDALAAKLILETWMNENP